MREVQRRRGRSASSGNTDAQTTPRQTPIGPGVRATNRANDDSIFLPEMSDRVIRAQGMRRPV
jgi:hypothetical protein